MKYPKFDQGLLTMTASGTVAEGEPVKVTANDTVAAGTAGVPFLGIAKEVEDDGYVGVQIDGIMEATYSGSAPSVGPANLTCDGSHAVKSAAAGNTGNHVYIIHVDTTNKVVYFINRGYLAIAGT